MTAAPREADSAVTVLDIDDIRIDGGTQPRDHINVEVAERYKALIEDGREFPPVTVFFDGQSYWLADGFHRITAWGSLGWTEVPVEVRFGSLRDAQWHSFSVNALHGYPRKDADIAKIMARIFTDAEWQDMPVRAIADHVGISATSAFYYRDRYLYGAQRRSSPPTVFTCEQSGSCAAEMQPPEPSPAPEWRQTDIEEFTDPEAEPAPAFAPRFPPEHTAPAEHIRWLVEQLHEAQKALSPAAAAATVSVGIDQYSRLAVAVAAWLDELWAHLDEENTDRE